MLSPALLAVALLRTPGPEWLVDPAPFVARAMELAVDAQQSGVLEVHVAPGSANWFVFE